jgi:predicted nucleic acid-binding Zn ribbon protein
MDTEEKLLRSCGQWRKKPVDRTESVGGVVRSYLSRQHRQLGKNTSVVDVWQEVLPGGFYEHCKLVGISGGVLRLEVDSGTYMHELRLMSKDLLEHLQERCPRAGIKKISLYARRGASGIDDEERKE